MDLLNMLSGLMTSSSSIDALSKKTGTDSSETAGIMDAALPMLLSALGKNASSEAGASSLLGALKQHSDTSAIEDQIAKADAEDGSKIIKHIFGDEESSVVKTISEKTGAGTDKITNLLSNAAPSLMSGLSAVTSQASKKTAAAKAENKTEAKEEENSGGLDLSGLLGIFGGSDSKEESGGLGGLLGGLGDLFGGSSDKDDDNDSGSSLLGVLKKLF